MKGRGCSQSAWRLTRRLICWVAVKELAFAIIRNLTYYLLYTYYCTYLKLLDSNPGKSCHLIGETWLFLGC